MCQKLHPKLNAFTLIEVLMTISLMAVLSTVSISMFNSSLDEAKFDATYKEMLQLRKAIIGDLENTTVEGERVRFGYLGDMGGLPPMSFGLAMLNTKPVSTPAYAIDSTSKLGVGWNGPYISSTEVGDYLQDAWGNDYIYRTDTTIPFISSLGSDAAVGGEGTAQDIQVDLPLSIRTATVHGQITSSGSVMETPAHVEIFYPDGSGALTSQEVTLSESDAGQFTFNNIPFGVRTLKIQIPSETSPVLTLGPVTFAVDDENYVIRSNALEVNPAASDANCNSVSNFSYVPGSFYNDTDNNKVYFNLKVKNSISTRNIYTFNNGAGSSSATSLEQIGIGGVVYGCKGVLDIIAYGGIDRKFNECARAWFIIWYDLGYVDLNSNSNLTLNSSWGIAAGDNVQAFMKFAGSTASLSWIDLRLGCDLIRIEE
ncbi:MAG: type II secretion system protein GspG [Bdellovibrionota bacterium]